MLPAPGSKVRHRVYGTGTVRRVRGELVDFHVDQFDMEVRVPAGELELLGARPKRVGKAPPRARTATAPPVASPPEARDATQSSTRPPRKQTIQASVTGQRDDASLLQAIEALRFGIVPPTRLPELTVGFENFATWVEDRLPHSHEGRPVISEISGPFGTGKSHGSAVIRHVAAENNYLTAHVEVDGQGVTLSDPAGLLHALWNTLSGQGFSSATPVLDLYVAALKKVVTVPRFVPRGADRIRENMSTVRYLHSRDLLDSFGYELDSLLSCSPEFTAAQVRDSIRRSRGFHSHHVQLRPMIGRRVDDRPYDFVEAIGGTAILAQMAGYRGLVVTIDEFEVEMWNLPAARLRRVDALVHVLRSYLYGETDHRASPLAIFFATTGDADTVGEAMIRHIVPSDARSSHRLSPLSAQGRNTLARGIWRLYHDAYGLTDPFDVTVYEQIERGPAGLSLDDSAGTRVFIKTLVGLLDARHAPPLRVG